MKKLIIAILMAMPLLSFSQYTYDQLEVILPNEATDKISTTCSLHIQQMQ
jgi:hypothetical protein